MPSSVVAGHPGILKAWNSESQSGGKQWLARMTGPMERPVTMPLASRALAEEVRQSLWDAIGHRGASSVVKKHHATASVVHGVKDRREGESRGRML